MSHTRTISCTNITKINALTDDQIKGRKTNLIESYEVTLSSPIGENKPANFSLTSVKPMI